MTRKARDRCRVYKSVNLSNTVQLARHLLGYTPHTTPNHSVRPTKARTVARWLVETAQLETGFRELAFPARQNTARRRSHWARFNTEACRALWTESRRRQAPAPFQGRHILPLQQPYDIRARWSSAKKRSWHETNPPRFKATPHSPRLLNKSRANSFLPCRRTQVF